MGVWTMVAMAAGGWCLLSVVVGVILGHAMAGKSLRSGDVRADTPVLPQPALLAEAFARDQRALDAARG